MHPHHTWHGDTPQKACRLYCCYCYMVQELPDHPTRASCTWLVLPQATSQSAPAPQDATGSNAQLINWFQSHNPTLFHCSKRITDRLASQPQPNSIAPQNRGKVRHTNKLSLLQR